jgi:hypothetical protein
MSSVQNQRCVFVVGRDGTVWIPYTKVCTYCHRNIDVNDPIFFFIFTYKSACLVLMRHICKSGYPYSRIKPINFQQLQQCAVQTTISLKVLP